MRSARRQHRAIPSSREAVNARSIAEIRALLHSETPPTSEQLAECERHVTQPREKRQGELPV